MRSMTGFGRGEAAANGWEICVELSGVNRKQIDISVNLPGSVADLEPAIRKTVSGQVSRGRVNVRVHLKHTETGDNELFFDEELANRYVSSAKKLAEEAGIETEIRAADLFRAPGVFRVEEAKAESDQIRKPLETALAAALDQLTSMQSTEGEHLRDDLEQRLQNIEDEVGEVLKHSPTVVDNYRKNLFSRLNESGLELNLDDERVLREIGIFAERCDISEEITRINSHAKQFRTYFSSTDPVGRSLDFLCQELNRELNTIGSKANDAQIAQRIVNAKTELEKIREQVQNVQ